MSFRAWYVLSVLLLFACNNEEADESNIDLLTSHNWMLTSAEVNPAVDIGSVAIEDIYDSQIFPQCMKDDELELNSDGTYIIHDGELICQDNENSGQTGTWKFSDDETQIILSGNMDTVQRLLILDLNSNYFKAAYTGTLDGLFDLPINDSSTYTLFLEYEH